MLFPHHARPWGADPFAKAGRKGICARLRDRYDRLWWTLFFLSLMAALASRNRRRTDR